MGLFDDFDGDVEEIAPASLGIPKGEYPAVLSHLIVEDTDGGKRLVFTYTVTEGPYKGKTQREFKPLVVGKPQSDKDVNSIAYIRQRLNSLGVPEEKHATTDPDDLIGIEVLMTLVPQKNDPSYNNVRIQLLDPSNPISLPTPSGTESAGNIQPASSVEDMFK